MTELRCPECNFLSKNLCSLGTHCAMKHGISGEKLYQILHNLNGPKLCECGCGEPTTYVSLTTGYRKLIQNHVSDDFLKSRGQKISKALQENKKTLTKETREKISNARKLAFVSGSLHSWNDKRFNENVKDAWNKGLTKESDERILAYGKKVSKTLKERFASGELNTWCDGLTKDNDQRLKMMSEKLVVGYASDKYKDWRSDKERLSNAIRLTGDANRLSLDEVALRFASRAADFTFIDDISRYDNNVTKLNFRCVQCAHEQEMTLHAFERGQLCTKCQLFRVSKAQIEIYEYVKECCNDAVLNDRSILSPKELDVYVPSKNFAIEFNGLYYHSDLNGAESNKHQVKSEECARLNVKLFHVFEDEWKHKKEIIKSMIDHRLRCSRIKVNARSCELVELTPCEEVKNFFNVSHIDGTGGRYDVAFVLRTNNVIVAALTLRKPFSKKWKNTIEVARFSCALNHSIPGAMSRLLFAATRWAKQQGYAQILSYVDQRFGGHDVYKHADFVKVSETPVRFWWTDLAKLVRYPRQKFVASSKENKTETDVAKEAGVHKIYGCKNTIMIKTL